MSSVFEVPKCFISNNPLTGKLSIHDDVLEEISGVKDQLNVVSITGLYRTGKSYLLNRLAGIQKGFPLGSAVQAKTKGIWAYALKHPVQKNQTLLLLDTEGLGDVRKGDERNDHEIFTLAMLLSSTLIYNMLGALNQDVVLKLGFMTELVKHIRVKKADVEADEDFDLISPKFILTLRDNGLEFMVDDFEVTPTQYLEDCLKPSTGKGDQTDKTNSIKKCIRQYFKNRECFSFVAPVRTKLLKDLEQLTDSDLDKDFLEDTKIFKDYVYKECGGFQLDTGTPINGNMFSQLAKHYITQIREGAVPCVESAIESMARAENEAAVERAILLHRTNLEQIKLPTETDDILLKCHLEGQKTAFKSFMESRVFDNGDFFYKRLMERIEANYIEFKRQNEDVSTELCRRLLEELCQDVRTKKSAGVYFSPGGYKIYREDMNMVEQKFQTAQGLGLMKREMYYAFISEMKPEEESILAADEKASDMQREFEEQKHKDAEEMRGYFEEMNSKREKDLEEMNSKNQRLVEELEETKIQENAKFNAKLEEIMQQRQVEIETMKNANLEVTKEMESLRTLLKDQEERNKDLNEQIGNLKTFTKEMEKEREKKSGIFQSVGRSVGRGLKWFGRGIDKGISKVKSYLWD